MCLVNKSSDLVRSFVSTFLNSASLEHLQAFRSCIWVQVMLHLFLALSLMNKTYPNILISVLPLSFTEKKLFFPFKSQFYFNKIFYVNVPTAGTWEYMVESHGTCELKSKVEPITSQAWHFLFIINNLNFSTGTNFSFFLFFFNL